MSEKEQTIMLGFHSQVDSRLMREWLISLGYKVVESLDNTAGIDLVLMDSVTARSFMDKAFGLKRAAKYFLPTLVCVNAGEDVGRWLKAGFDDALRLPVSKAEWRARIDIMLRLRSQSEELGRKSEMLHQALIESSIDHIFLLDTNGTYVTSNDRVDHLGLERGDEVVGKTIDQIYPQEVAPFYRTQLQRVLTEGKTVVFEHNLPSDQETYHHLDTLYPVNLPDGTLMVGGICRDITERKQAEEKLNATYQQLEANYQQLIATEQALRKSEEKFRLAFINSPDSVNITRLSDGKLLESSNSFEKITGHKLSDSLGKKTSDLNLWANPGDRELMKEKLSRDGKIENFEFIRKMKNGDTAFSVMTAAIITINNEPHLLSVIRDVDDLKKAEINIRESEVRLKEAELIAQMGNFIWDIKSGDVTWSDGLHALLGYDKSEKIDYNKVNAEIHHPDDLERITAWLNECIASGKSNFPPNEYRLLRKDGKVIQVQTTVKVLLQDDLPHKIIGSVQDITERKQAENAVRQSEERYRLMLNTTLDGFILADEEGKIMQVNPGYCNMIGYSEQELLSMNIRNIEAKLSDQEVKERIQQMVSQGKVRFETRHQAKDGHLIDLEVSVSIFQNDKKQPLVAAFVRDITERKLAEEALKESELKFQKIISESFAGISVVNEEGKIIVWNNALEEITGIKSTETVDRYIWDVEAALIARETNGTKRMQELKSKILGTLKTGKAPWLNKVFEREYIHPDGTVKLVSGRMYTIKTQKGYVVVSVSNDITESKWAERALKEARSNLQALLDNRIDSIWSLDRNYNYLVFNKPYADVIFSNMGIRLEKGMNALEIHPKEVADFWKPKMDEVFQGKYVTFEFSHVLEGKEHFFEVRMNPIYTDNKVSGLSALSMDITERKQAEEELRNYHEHLEELVKERTEELQSSNKELEAFSYSVSHDLRAPLRAINGFTRILMEDYVEKLDDEGKRLGDVIRNNAQKMGKLIDDLLAFSRLGRTSMQFSNIDMKNMVNAIYHEASNSSEQKRIEFSVADLPDAYGDSNMMRQVWMNLISNAIKFSSKREKAVISISGSQDDENVTYRISDNGAGFDMQYVDKIFEVFQRLHGEAEYPGTGVGLSLVQRIINRHKGKIWAESEVDKGATFYFSLPKKGINETNEL